MTRRVPPGCEVIDARWAAACHDRLVEKEDRRAALAMTSLFYGSLDCGAAGLRPG